jgi:site-specific DNA recombinase
MSKKSKMRTGNCVAAYARYSSENQNDASIDAQMLAIEKYCKENGLHLVKTYIDRAKSATTDRRPAFLEMIGDSKLDLFDGIIFHKLDRFSRDTNDTAIYKRILRENGVRLISVLEHLDGSPESGITEALLSAMAEYYSKNLAREVMKGFTQNALKCKTTGGHPPLGYDIDRESKKYVLNETEAITIREIFKLYNEGSGYNKIIGELNAKGYKTKNGNYFGKNSIHDILCNEKYTGVYVFNRSASKAYDGTRNNHESKDDEDIIRVPGGVPTIISQEDFDKTQQRMKVNKRSPGAYTAKETYLLSGLVFCGECGRRMTGNMRYGGRNKTKFVSYKCGYRENYKACENKEIRREYLESYVLAELERLVLNDEAIPKLSQKLQEYQSKKKSQNDVEITAISAKLHDINVKIGNIVNAIANGYMQSIFKEKMSALEEEKALLETRLREIETSNPAKKIDEAMLKKMIGMFQQFVREKNVPECKKFIQAFVQKVDVFKDHVEVTFKVPSSFSTQTECLTIKTEERIKTLFRKFKVA